MHSFPTLCCSIASHPSPSGQAVHNALYEQLGLPFRYVAFGVHADPGSIVNAIRTLGIRGAGITMPYKETLLPYLDEIDEDASQIGAINTLVNENGHIKGYNVDWLGAMRALEHQQIDVSGKKVVLVGAGGAARAIAFGLKKKGAQLIGIYNRTESRGQTLATDLDLPFGGNLNNIPSQYDLLVHATSAGHLSQPQQCVIPDHAIVPKRIIFDIVPEPKNTPLLQLAGKKDCEIIYGYSMRMHQAAAQFELYTGEKAPLELMESLFLKQLESPS